jgi:hypothetical protein
MRAMASNLPCHAGPVQAGPRFFRKVSDCRVIVMLIVIGAIGSKGLSPATNFLRAS